MSRSRAGTLTSIAGSGTDSLAGVGVGGQAQCFPATICDQLHVFASCDAFLASCDAHHRNARRSGPSSDHGRMTACATARQMAGNMLTSTAWSSWSAWAMSCRWLLRRCARWVAGGAWKFLLRQVHVHGDLHRQATAAQCATHQGMGLPRGRSKLARRLCCSCKPRPHNGAFCAAALCMLQAENDANAALDALTNQRQQGALQLALATQQVCAREVVSRCHVTTCC